VAEHVAEFKRNDYTVVLADDGTYAGELSSALADLGLPALAGYESNRPYGGAERPLEP
jgi:hypothetical protein